MLAAVRCEPRGGGGLPAAPRSPGRGDLSPRPRAGVVPAPRPLQPRSPGSARLPEPVCVLGLGGAALRKVCSQKCACFSRRRLRARPGELRSLLGLGLSPFGAGVVPGGAGAVLCPTCACVLRAGAGAGPRRSLLPPGCVPSRRGLPGRPLPAPARPRPRPGPLCPGAQRAGGRAGSGRTKVWDCFSPLRTSLQAGEPGRELGGDGDAEGGMCAAPSGRAALGSSLLRGRAGTGAEPVRRESRSGARGCSPQPH